MDATVLVSGGIDSAACLRFFQERGSTVRGVFVDYGQMALSAECEAAYAISTHLGVPITTLRFTAPQKFGPGEIRGRNAFLVFAALMGAGVDHGIVSLGIHGGTPYYDCSEVFVEAIGAVVLAYSSGKVVLDCPFIRMPKPTVYEYARGAGVPLGMTYSCERGTRPPCGRCLSCRDRRALEAG